MASNGFDTVSPAQITSFKIALEFTSPPSVQMMYLPKYYCIFIAINVLSLTLIYLHWHWCTSLAIKICCISIIYVASTYCFHGTKRISGDWWIITRDHKRGALVFSLLFCQKSFERRADLMVIWDAMAIICSLCDSDFKSNDYSSNLVGSFTVWSTEW